MSNGKAEEWTGCAVWLLIIAATVYACTPKDKDTSSKLEPVVLAADAAADPTAIAAPTPPPSPVVVEPPKPQHYYEAVEGSIYYYSAEVTEEQRKTGKRAPDMLAFRYLGRDDEGRDQVQFISGGEVLSVSSCARPCRAIHRDDGSVIGYDERSIIGAVFADSSRGFLKPYKPKPKPSPSAVPFESIPTGEPMDDIEE